MMMMTMMMMTMMMMTMMMMTMLMMMMMMMTMMMILLVWRSSRHQIARFGLNLHHRVCVTIVIIGIISVIFSRYITFCWHGRCNLDIYCIYHIISLQ